MDNHTDFSRGPYNEILPPPLVGGVDEEEALAMLAQDAEARGQPISIPTRGQSRKGMYNLAMLFVHQQNLKRALQGQSDDPDGQALYEAVVKNGELLSLRPAGMESLFFFGFAPVFGRVAESQWRVGLPEHGQTAAVAGEAGAAIEAAWKVYVEWSKQEAERFAEIADRFLKAVPHALNHDYWAAQMRDDETRAAQIADAVAVEWLGKHQSFRLTTPKGTRLFESSSPERAARIGEAVARQMKVEPQYPSPADMLRVFCADGGAPRLRAIGAEGVWMLGHDQVRAKWEGGDKRLAVIADRRGVEPRSYALVLDKKSIVELREAGKPIASIALPPNVAKFLSDPDSQAVVLWWAMQQLDAD